MSTISHLDSTPNRKRRSSQRSKREPSKQQRTQEQEGKKELLSRLFLLFYPTQINPLSTHLFISNVHDAEYAILKNSKEPGARCIDRLRNQAGRNYLSNIPRFFDNLVLPKM